MTCNQNCRQGRDCDCNTDRTDILWDAVALIVAVCTALIAVAFAAVWAYGLIDLVTVGQLT